MAFTFFFRDSHTLNLLMQHAIPVLRGQSFIRIWDAGCAYGPEPYTLAIMFREAMSEFLFRNLKIYATDIDRNFEKRINLGIYSNEETGRIPLEIKMKYFTACEGGFQLEKGIMNAVEFSCHDLLGLKPIRAGLSLIVCKNVLLHFPEKMREKVIKMFHSSLREGGFLVMENTQPLPLSLKADFDSVEKGSRIFRKNYY